MPFGDDVSDMQLRLMLYGKAKTRKTWWALMAAELGYNVILFDGDRGGLIVNKLSPAAKKRVRIIECSDAISRPIFADFMIKYLSNNTLKWDDTLGELVTPVRPAKKTSAHFVLDVSKLTWNDVLIFDSWDAFMASLLMTKFSEEGWDWSASAVSDLRGAFGYQNRLGTFALNKFMSLPCHVIVIAHETVNELTEPGTDDKGKSVRIPTGEVYTQPLSSSRAHGLTLSSKFTDVLYFYHVGERVRVSTKSNDERDGGSRVLYVNDEWEKVQFKDFLGSIKSLPVVPDSDCPSCVYYPIGTPPGGTVEANTITFGAKQAEPIPNSAGGTTIGAATKPEKTTMFTLTKGS